MEICTLPCADDADCGGHSLECNLDHNACSVKSCLSNTDCDADYICPEYSDICAWDRSCSSDADCSQKSWSVYESRVLFRLSCSSQYLQCWNSIVDAVGKTEIGACSSDTECGQGMTCDVASSICISEPASGAGMTCQTSMALKHTTMHAHTDTYISSMGSRTSCS